VRLYVTPIAVSALVLAVAGCGDESGGSSSPSGTPTAGSSTSQPAPTSSAPAPAFPLTVSRTGGFAGFDDKLVIEADGSATLTRRKVATRCTVDPALLATITTSATKVDWSALPVKPPTVEHPDDMVVSVSARGGVAELGDPRVGALNAPLSRLLADAGNPAGQRKLCR
jgi:hypothetical protein